MQFLRENLPPIILAVLYMISVFFALAAVLPERLAFQLALVATILALVVYRILAATEKQHRELPAGLLFLIIPITCSMVGLVWWLLRLVGLLGN